MVKHNHNPKQESDADMFAYEFMKKSGFEENGVESAFLILAKKSRKEVLYKPYLHQVPEL